MAGTKYNTKEDLINALQNRVFKNNNFQTTSSGIQTNDLDVVESLWDKNTGFIKLATYDELVSLKSSSGLIPGGVYSVPYQGKNVIPGTTIINTNSTNYVPNIETFIFQAISEAKINPLVRSLENESDIIYWNTDSNLTEDGAEARTGKVYYREDLENNLSTYYDFRSVYFRLGEVTTSAEVSTWTTGQNWNRGDMVLTGGELRRASYALTLNTSVETHDWQTCSKSIPLKWVWKDTISNYCGKSIERNTTVLDRLTFSAGSSNITVGRTTQNDGYNNICFNGCTNITLSDNCYDSYMESCSNVSILKGMSNSLVGVTSNYKTNTIASSFIWSVTNSSSGELLTDSIYGADDLTIQFGSNNNNYSFVRKVTVGQDADSNSAHSVDRASIGNSASNNIIRNIDNSDFEHSLATNSFVGVSDSSVANNVHDCIMDISANVYTVITNLSISNGCYNLNYATTGDVDQLAFGERCHDITILGGPNIDNLTFESGCYNFTVESGSSIQNTIFNSNCNDFTLTTGTLNNSSFGNSCSGFTLTNSSISNSSFGNSCSTISVTSSSNIYDSIFGNVLNNITLVSATINNCKFGNQNQYIDLATGSYIGLTSTENAVANITLSDNSRIEYCTVGSDSSNILLNADSTLAHCILKGNNSLTINANVDVRFADFSVGNKSKTFSGVNGVNEYSKFKAQRGDSSSRTYGGSVDPELAINPASKSTVGATKAGYTTSDAGVYTSTSAVDHNISADMMPTNVVLVFEIQNTDVSSHTVTFGSDLAVAKQSSFTINASKSNIVTVLRIDGYNDKVVILSNTEL